MSSPVHASSAPRHIRDRRFLQLARRVVPGRWRGPLRRALFDWLDLSWTTRQQVALRVANYNEWIVYNEIFVDGEYDPAIQAAVDRLPAGRPLQVLDLGANVGFFTLRVFDRLRARGLSDARAAVTLVDANPALISILHRRLRHDNSLGPCVRIVHGAAGTSAGAVDFYPSSLSPGDGSTAARTTAVAIRVPTADLDDLMAAEPQIDLLKCDIEGAELTFFEHSSSLLRKTAILVVEIHAEQCPVERCREIVAAAGLTHETILRDRGGCALHLYARV